MKISLRAYFYLSQNRPDHECREQQKSAKKQHTLPPSRPFLRMAGQADGSVIRRAGLSRLRRCRTAGGYGLDSKTATAGYTALCLPYFPANFFPGGLVDSQPRLTLSTGSTKATYAPRTSFLGRSGRGNRASTRHDFAPAETGPKEKRARRHRRSPIEPG